MFTHNVTKLVFNTIIMCITARTSWTYLINHFNQSMIENYSIQSTYIPKINFGNECNILKVKISSEIVDLCLLFHEIGDIISNRSQIIIQDGNASRYLNFGDLDVRLIHGYVVTKGDSFIKGYIHNNRFFGNILIGSKIYHVEPYSLMYEGNKSEYSTEDAIIYQYQGETLDTSGFNRHNYNQLSSLDDTYGFADAREAIHGKLCSLMVAVDNSFFQKVGQGSIETCTTIFLMNLDEANAILRSADLDNDGIPDNVGIVVEKIIFITSESPDIGSILKVSINQLVDPKDLLRRFTSLPLLHDVCLGILLTAQPFTGNYLGVSYTPGKDILMRYRAGICSHMHKEWHPMNSLLVTYRFDTGTLLPNVIVDMNLAHELGHSFGSDHDTGKCARGYIMSSRSSMPSNYSNYMFSKCSRRDMTIILRNQGFCLVQTTETFCGNARTSWAYLINHFNQTMIENYSIQSTYIPKINFGNECNILKVKIFSEIVDLCLLLHEIRDIINDRSQIIIQDGTASRYLSFGDLDVRLIHGYVVTKGDSFIKGYIHNNRFFGNILIGSKIYHVEPYSLMYDGDKSEYSTEDAIIYQYQGDILDRFGFNRHNYNQLSSLDDTYGFVDAREAIHGKLCPLLVTMDNSFLQKVGKGSIETCTKIFLMNLDEANAVLRSADLDDDGIPDNVGIVVEKIILKTSESPDIDSILKVSINQLVDAIDLLRRFTFLPLSYDVCLRILLTAQPFTGSYLGVSYTPRKDILMRHRAGICAHRHKDPHPRNSLLVTYMFDTGTLLPNVMADMNLAHELGHSLGSDHDTGECEGGYIMSSRTSMPSNSSNFMFSKCSRQDMATILNNQGFCLVQTTKTFCGNGLVEDGEDCDCGSSYICALKDRCCNPRNSKDSCRLNKNGGHQCHPSQGLCCTSDCRFRDMRKFGLDCAGLQNKCPCRGPSCSCGISGTCVENECHSTECTRIGLKECTCGRNEDNKCATCCAMPDGKCVRSQRASRRIIESTAGKFNLGTYSDIKATMNHILEEFCKNGRCFKLAFAVYRTGTYCTVNGVLGKCLDSTCSVPKLRSNTFPVFNKSSIATTFQYTFVDSFVFTLCGVSFCITIIKLF